MEIYADIVIDSNFRYGLNINVSNFKYGLIANVTNTKTIQNDETDQITV